MRLLPQLSWVAMTMCMIYFLLFFLEIGLLFVFSRVVSKSLSRFLPIHILAIFFLPGVIVHELSHMIIAAIMFVRVGEVEFRPKIEEGGLKLGSVAIAKTDPIRRAVIGFAPVFVGISLILGIVYFVSKNLLFFQTNQVYVAVFAGFGIVYILFVISNTMFSSKKDMEGALEVLIAFLVVFTVLYFAGPRFPPYLMKIIFSNEVIGLVQKSTLFLLAPIVIDLVILGIVRTLADGRR